MMVLRVPTVVLAVLVGLGRQRSQLMSVVEGVRDRWRADCVGSARTSLYHRQYPTLDLDLGDKSVLCQTSDISLIFWIIKARTELIRLNYKPWMSDANYNCSLWLISASPCLDGQGLGGLESKHTENEERSVGIYNGNSTTINKHKYLVGILRSGKFTCAGSIVSETWVVTVADCTTGMTASELSVVGSSKDGISGESYNVLQIVEHPDYGTNKLDYDYSCVQVDGHFYYWSKRTLKLPTAEPKNNTVMTVAGYGYTDSTSESRELLQASMTWLPKDTCESTYKNFDFTWSTRMACADNADGATLCKGDYGDAMVVSGVLYGMFSGGSSSGFCTSSAKPVIMADVFPAATWIANITGASYTTDSF